MALLSLTSPPKSRLVSIPLPSVVSGTPKPILLSTHVLRLSPRAEPPVILTYRGFPLIQLSFGGLVKGRKKRLNGCILFEPGFHVLLAYRNAVSIHSFRAFPEI